MFVITLDCNEPESSSVNCLLNRDSGFEPQCITCGVYFNWQNPNPEPHNMFVAVQLNNLINLCLL